MEEERPGQYGTHSMGRSEAPLIYQRTKNLRAAQLLLGHSTPESRLLPLPLGTGLVGRAGLEQRPVDYETLVQYSVAGEGTSMESRNARLNSSHARRAPTRP